MKHKQYSALTLGLFKRMTLALALVSGGAYADAIDFSKLSSEQVRSAVEVKIRMIRHMALNPVLVNAVKDQNNENVEAVTVKRRGVAWEKSAVTNGLKKKIDNSDASLYLKRRVSSRPEFSRALLTDKQGANVANYPSARSYTHSKTESWAAAWNKGLGKIHLSKPLLDKRWGTHSVQISAPVQDRGVTIGVLMVDVAIENYGTKPTDKKPVTKSKPKKSSDSNVAKKETDSEKPAADEAQSEQPSSTEVGSVEQSTDGAVTDESDSSNIVSDTTR